MKISTLGYAALGATLGLVFPKFSKRLAIDAAILKIKRYEMFRAMRHDYAAAKGEALTNLNNAVKVQRKRCNHKKGGSLGNLTVKAWHHTGVGLKYVYNAQGECVRHETIPGANISGGATCGISRWEGEWTGENTYITGQGDSNQYAVTKHQYANGDVHVRCMRCGTNWKPGDEGYEDAINWHTLNSPSSSVQFGTGFWRNLSDPQEQLFQANYNKQLGDFCPM